MDSVFGKDSSIVEKTKAFDYPVRKNKYGEYKVNSSDSPIYVCLSSDFFIEDADEWRGEIWEMIKARSEIDFRIITKRIERFRECIPKDWGEGYENVTVICTCENQKMADKRLPIFLEMPIRHREIIHEPMLESIDISQYLKSGKIEKVSCGGESGENARICKYEWVVNTRNQCVSNNVSFVFRQTGANFVKNEKLYHIPREKQISQAEKAGINFKALYNSECKKKKSKTEQYYESEDYKLDNPFNSILLQLSKSPLHSDISLSRKDRVYYLSHSIEEIQKETEEVIKESLYHIIPKDKDKHTRERGKPVYVEKRETG